MASVIVYVGTIGEGIWRSTDGGETFVRACRGMFMEAEVRWITVHPLNDRVLFAATDAGVWKTENGGDDWTLTSEQTKGWQVWACAVHPKHPNVLFAGTRPGALYRSVNGGTSWQECRAEISKECPVIFYTRVTQILCDPMDEHVVWAGVEIDGAFRSDDGGVTWTKLTQGLSSLDIHGMTVALRNGSKTIIAATNNDVNISTDNGATWVPQKVEQMFPWRYCRAVVTKADDPRVVLVGNGDGPPGRIGAVQRSTDGGKTWQQAEMDVTPNSTVWNFATHPADPNLIYASCVSGYVYRSTDGGATWSKCPHEFGEVRALAWVPG